MSVLPVVVIGQSPRPDVAALVASLVGPGIEIRLAGALDGLDRAQLDRIRPADGGDTLFTVLPSGEGIAVSKRAVAARAGPMLDRLRADGHPLTLFCCTGRFPPLENRPGVIFPSRVLDGWIEGLLPRGRLAVLVPLPEQVAVLERRWAGPGRTVAVAALAPTAPDDAFAQAAERFAVDAPDLVVLDCISYTAGHKAAVRRVLGDRVVLGLSAAARTIRELIG